jgi:hypothetical protein
MSSIKRAPRYDQSKPPFIDSLCHHGLSKETGWEQALGQDEVVKALNVKLTALRFLCRNTYLPQPQISVKIRICLARHAEGEAFHFLIARASENTTSFCITCIACAGVIFPS